jgi:hypothetical protein
MYILCLRACVCACVRAGVCVCVSSRYTPTAAEYLPASQDVQLAASEEVDPSAPYVPAAHTKPEHVEAPESALYFPASQSVQEVAPEVAAENFPAKNHRTITMRESCTCCVSSTGERQRNLLHRSYKSEIHHSTDQLVLLRSTPMTHTTHTPVHCQ